MKPVRPLAIRAVGFAIPALLGSALLGGALFSGGAVVFRGGSMSTGTLVTLGTVGALLIVLAVYWWRQAFANWSRR